MAVAGDRKKVLFIINSLAGGGAERVLLELIAASDRFRDRYDIALALLDDEPREYAPAPWLQVHQLDARYKFGRSITALLKLCRDLRPDATLAFLTRANLASVAVARIMGHRAIISERVNTSGHFDNSASGLASKTMVRVGYPFADAVIAASGGIEDDLADNFGVPREKLSTIANPVNMQRIRQAASAPVDLPVEGPFAVAMSRLSKNKNVVLAVEALAASGLALPLVILGQGPEEAAIRARAAALGIADQVLLLGFVANPYPILSAASCYIAPSNAEGFPNGLVEALALGVPVVATNCPSGPSEILLDAKRQDAGGVRIGRGGILVPQNKAADLASAIRQALESECAAVLSAAGPKRAADFSLESSRDQYWKIIESLI